MFITKENINFFYINMEKRLDKKTYVESHFKSHNLIVERFNALTVKDNLYNISTLPCNDGQKGCMFSHLQLLTNHMNSGSDKILGIFEDDVKLCDDFNDRFNYISENFNKEWDIFFFTSFYHLNNDPKKWKPIEFEFTDIKYINRVYSSFCTHAYLVNPKSINKIIDLCLKNANRSYAIDHLYLLIEPELNCYSFTPGMANQIASVNDIDNHYKDQTVFEQIVGNHYFVNNLTDFNYEEFYEKNKL